MIMAIKKTYKAPSKPTPKPCPSCKRLVLAGLDGRAAALSVVIDAEVLTRDAELLMIIAGTNVYATNSRDEILRRNPSEVLAHGEHLQMHREHDCAKTTPAHLIAPTPPKTQRTTNDEEVPF
jgi:hypothetical protein